MYIRYRHENEQTSLRIKNQAHINGHGVAIDGIGQILFELDIVYGATLHLGVSKQLS